MIGGAGNDLLIGDGGNMLNGGAGRDILIGGRSASTLDGGAGEDLLIAGTTVYDTDQAKLSALRTYWAGTDSYPIRISKLTGGIGVPKLNATTVMRNGASNVLIGSSELDLYFAILGSDRLVDRATDETVVNL